jgi:hypothetical protein
LTDFERLTIMPARLYSEHCCGVAALALPSEEGKMLRGVRLHERMLVTLFLALGVAATARDALAADVRRRRARLPGIGLAVDSRFVRPTADR